MGSSDFNLYTLNAVNGALVWNFTTGGAVISCSAISNGVLYLGSYDKKVYAVNTATGTQIWSYKTGGVVESSPLVANGMVYFGSDQTNSLNAETGASVWNFSIGYDVCAQASPAYANGLIYTGGAPTNSVMPGYVYALNGTTGAIVWNYMTAGGIFAPPAIVGNSLYVGSYDNKTNALDAATGNFVGATKPMETSILLPPSLTEYYTSVHTTIPFTPLVNGKAVQAYP